MALKIFKNPTIGEALSAYPKHLDYRYGSPERDVEDFLCQAVKCDRAHMLSSLSRRLTNVQLTRFLLMFDRRQRGIPPQYVLGFTYFNDLKIRVNEHVLIPRPETELLVKEVENFVRRHPVRNIVDLGTGSGAIIISLAKKLSDKEYNFIATDISVRALYTARLNAFRNKVSINFRLRDFIAKPNTFLPLTSWILVSNPPYLKESEMNEPSIQFEPKLALYGGADGLDAFRAIMNHVKNLQNKPKGIFFEIGYSQGESVSKMIKTNFPEAVIEVVKDDCGKDRVVKAVF